MTLRGLYLREDQRAASASKTIITLTGWLEGSSRYDRSGRVCV